MRGVVNMRNGTSDDLIASASLSEYASNTRYPGFEESVTEEEYREAVGLAESVVKWAEDIIGG